MTSRKKSVTIDFMFAAECSKAKGNTGDGDGCFGKRDYIFGSCAAEEGDGMAIQRLSRGTEGMVDDQPVASAAMFGMHVQRTRLAGSDNTFMVAGLVQIDGSAWLSEVLSVQVVGRQAGVLRLLCGTSLGYIHELACGLPYVKLPLNVPQRKRGRHHCIARHRAMEMPPRNKARHRMADCPLTFAWPAGGLNKWRCRCIFSHSDSPVLLRIPQLGMRAH